MEPYMVEENLQFRNLCNKIKELDRNVILQGFHKGSDMFIKISRVSSEDFPAEFLPNVYTIVYKLQESEVFKVSVFSYNGEEIEYSCFPADEETIEKIISIYITSRLNSYQMCHGLRNTEKPLLDNLLIEKYGNKLYFRSKDCSRLVIGSSICTKCEDSMIKSEFNEITDQNLDEPFQSIKEEVEDDCSDDDYKGFESKEQSSKIEGSSYKDDLSTDLKSPIENRVSNEQPSIGQEKKEKRKYKKKSAYWISPEKGPKKCKLCEKVFSTTWNLNKHMQNTHEAKPVPCYICGKMIKSKLYLDVHVKLVHGEKRFKCEVDGCQNAYHTKTHLMDHVAAVHEGIARYTCSVCGKMHKYQAARIKCENTHKGKFGYECDLCDKKFQSKNTYEGHRRSHTGEKPFSCPICSIKMSRRDKVKEHIKVVHKMTWQEAEIQTNTKIEMEVTQSSEIYQKIPWQETELQTNPKIDKEVTQSSESLV